MSTDDAAMRGRMEESLRDFARTAVLARIGTDLAATVRDLQARVERLEAKS